VSSGELWTYLGVFTALVAAGLGFPIPEELPVVTGGAMCGTVDGSVPKPLRDMTALVGMAPGGAGPAGLPWEVLLFRGDYDWTTFRLRWWVMLPVCILGVVFSDGLLYGVGRLFGRRLLEHRRLSRLVPEHKRERIEHNFHKYGIKILLFARFLPGIRAPIFVTAGMMRLPLSHFLLADGLYAIPGVSLLFSLAYWFTNAFTDLVERAEAHIRPILIIVVILAVAVYLVYHFLRKPVPEGDPEEMPIIGPQVAAHLKPEEDVCPESPPNGEAVTPEGGLDTRERSQTTEADPHP
jgi:membrane protein DedA with SNARE-associated domain